MERTDYPTIKKRIKTGLASFLGSLMLLFFSLTNVQAQLTYCTITNAGGPGSMLANTQFGSINYNSVNPPSTFYTYVTSQTTSVVLGSTDTLKVTVDASGTYTGAIISVWFDWNQDGTLSASEWTQVATNAPSGTQVAVPITIPATATPGLTRMRLRSRGNGNQNGSGDACTSMGSGESIDFDITVISGTPCSGTPNAGTVATSVPDSVCPNVAFQLTTTGTTFGTGMTYQWQTATSATGPWTDIAGATNIGYTVSSGITIATYYRMKATCSAGTPVYTNVKSVGVKSFLQCYCTPTYTTGCTVGDDIKDVTLVGNSYTLSNLNTPCPAGGYMDYTTDTSLSIPDLTPGLSYNGTVTTNYSCCEYVKIWIDYNNDGTFDTTNEQAASFGAISNSSTGAYSFTVPVTATPGQHRMRVRLVYSPGSSLFDACSNNYYGEAHDYLVNIQALLPCTSPPTSGTLSGVDSICANNPFILNAQGTSTGSGLVYQWQSAPSATGPWTDITGANLLNLNVPNGITAATSYRLKVVCSGGTPVYTPVKTVTLKSYISCYCPSVTQYGCQWDTRIESFFTTGATTNISNLNTGCANTTTGYSDYTTMGITAMQGTSFNYSVTIGEYDGGVKIWADWNHDGYFDPVTELIAASTSNVTVGVPFTGTVYVPANATPGNARIRVKTVEFDTAFTACSTGYYGETEDYTITVVQATPCTNPPNAAAITGVDSICANNQFTLQTTGISIGTGLVYQWQSAPSATGPWTDITGATTPTLYVTSGITTATHYRFKSVCSNGTPVYSPVKSITMKSYINCYCTSVALYGCQWGAHVNSFYTTGAIANVSNLNTGCANTTTGYSDYTSMTITAMQGTTLDYSVNVGYNDGGVKIWADWNHDGYFDPVTELVAASTGLITSGTSFTGTATVPTTAVAGPARFRVKVVDYSTTFTPCSSDPYAETEDYTINVAPSVPCTNPPSAGGISSVDSICPSVSFVMQDTGASIGSGLVYQWESATSATGPWTAITGATNLSYANPGINAATYYRLKAVCSNGTPVYSAAKLVNIKPYNQCYCTPIYTTNCAVGDDISNVTLTGVTTNINNSTGCSTNGYGDYTTTVAPADLNPGDSFDLKVSTSYGSPTSEKATAWIDYNQNGVFDANEVIFNTPNGLASGGTTQTFLVPATQAAGLYRMRVRVIWNGIAPLDPCSQATYGEVEDYMVQIGPPCPLTTPTLGADTTICANAPITLNAGTQPTGATYAWSNGASTQTISVNTAGTYTVTVADAGGICTKSDTITIAVNPAPTVNLGADTTLCNGGPYVANAGGTANYSYLWTPGGETSNTKTISTSGTYSVKVTNSMGCSASDTINVVIAELPSVTGITTTGASPTFNFSPNNPLNVTTYLWEFGEGNTATTQNASHTYPILGQSKAYTVCLTVSNDCGEQQVCTNVTVTGNSIKDLNLNTDVLKLYPNPTAQTVTIDNNSGFRMKNIVITNVLGQQVMKIAVKSNKQVVDVSNLISGLYQVTIEFEEGTVNRKLEVIK
ncbi:MAG TPA: GEVED domain-containing protein [Edaphocola sp.]|nr:GEVED domain-containing protein [Edaphocola sp.]